ncbi:MAG: tetratricopeptide repeat-containing sensor histidine kinase [Bacteroidetes bacterium]|nr:tetratricopeptide repeat-containing sensor histidine kinase [Bacteroidota bacterium]
MKKGLVFFFLVISVLKFYSQTDNKKTDSLLSELKSQRENITRCNILNELSKSYYMVNPEEGLKYAEKAFQLSLKINYKTGIANAFLNKARNYSVLGEYYKTLEFCEKAKKIYLDLNDDCSLGLCFLNMGNTYGNLGKFPDALNAFFNALRSFEKCPNKKNEKNIASCYQNIGNIYNATQNYTKALNSYDTAIVLFSKIKGGEAGMAMNIASKGTIYQKQSKPKESIRSYEAAEKILIPLKEDVLLAFVRSWKGGSHLDLEEYDKSLENSTSALKTISEVGDQELTASTIQNIGYAYLKKGMRSGDNNSVELGYSNLIKSLTIYKELNSMEGLMKNYLYLSEYYKFKNDYKNSLEFFSTSTQYHDSIFNLKNKQSLQNIEDERTIELRDSEIKLNKLELEAKEKQKWLFILGLILFAFIGILLFYQSRNRKKNNEKLKLLNDQLEQANKIKMRFFSILNHDLRGPVANIIHFLHLQKESPELLDIESKARLYNQTISGAEHLLNSMEDILLWSKGQMENFSPQPKKTQVNLLFEEINNHFSSTEKIKLLFENPQNLEIDTDPDYLKTIMRNLTSNAIKALEKTENARIIWKAWQENKVNYLSVTDNGPGGSIENFKALYDENEVVGIKTGLGLHLIRDLAKAIKCKISIENDIKQGTKFILTFAKVA